MDDDDAELQTRRSPTRIVRPRAPRVCEVPERRQHSRRNVRCECWLEREGQSLYSAEADVAGHELFLRTGVPLRTGEAVEVSLQLRGSEQPVQARGVVTRIMGATTGQRAAVGVSLSEILAGAAELDRRLSMR